MALTAGVMSITAEFAKDLKDGDWFGKQDPYCIIKCGTQQFRTKTAVDGGKNPVWNETFSFNLINENSIEIEIKDEDVGKDDLIGTCTISLARAREQGADQIQAPVVSKKSKKQHGFISVRLSFQSNDSLKPGGQHGGHAPQQPMMMAAASPMYYAAPPPMPMPYGYPPVPYGYAPAPYAYPPQQGFPSAAPPPAGVPAPKA